MKYPYLIGAGALSLALGAAALAVPAMTGGMKADADGNGVISKAEAITKAEKRFAAMDANGDGQLNPDDHTARAKERFAKMDADKNGAISEAEFLAAGNERATRRKDRWNDNDRSDNKGQGTSYGRNRSERGGKHGDAVGMMAKADSNGDKAVTLAEYRAAAETRFAATDTNKDGGLSATELQAARAKKKAERQAMRR